MKDALKVHIVRSEVLEVVVPREFLDKLPETELATLEEEGDVGQAYQFAMTYAYTANPHPFRRQLDAVQAEWVPGEG